MVRRLVSAALLGVSAWCAACAGAACAGATWAASSRPTITIMSPANSAVHYGTSITMRVAVKNFMLLPPRLRNPPPLKGDRGHIHYVLDDMSSFVPSRAMTVQLSQTWTDVPPGRHVLIAEQLLAEAQDTVRDRDGDLHDTHGRRLVDKTTNQTTYQFGYLYMADSLCYWNRELAQVKNLLGDASVTPPACVF